MRRFCEHSGRGDGQSRRPGRGAGSGAGPAAVVGTKARPAVEDCGLAPATVRPRDLTLSCADGGTLGVNLAWQTWGPAEAYAKGVYTWNPCTPYCAAAKKWGKTTASFTLEDPVHTKTGWLFEKLVVRLTGKLPPHTSRVLTFAEKPLAAVKDDQ